MPYVVERNPLAGHRWEPAWHDEDRGVLRFVRTGDVLRFAAGDWVKEAGKRGSQKRWVNRATGKTFYGEHPPGEVTKEVGPQRADLEEARGRHATATRTNRAAGQEKRAATREQTKAQNLKAAQDALATKGQDPDAALKALTRDQLKGLAAGAGLKHRAAATKQALADALKGHHGGTGAPAAPTPAAVPEPKAAPAPAPEAPKTAAPAPPAPHPEQPPAPPAKPEPPPQAVPAPAPAAKPEPPAPPAGRPTPEPAPGPAPPASPEAKKAVDDLLTRLYTPDKRGNVPFDRLVAIADEIAPGQGGDVVQDVATKFLENPGPLAGATNPEGFFTTAVKNAALSLARKRQTKVGGAADLDHDPAAPAGPETEPGAAGDEDVLERVAAQIKAVVDKLPGKQRVALEAKLRGGDGRQAAIKVLGLEDAPKAEQQRVYDVPASRALGREDVRTALEDAGKEVRGQDPQEVVAAIGRELGGGKQPPAAPAPETTQPAPAALQTTEGKFKQARDALKAARAAVLKAAASGQPAPKALQANHRVAQTAYNLARAAVLKGRPQAEPAAPAAPQAPAGAAAPPITKQAGDAVQNPQAGFESAHDAFRRAGVADQLKAGKPLSPGQLEQVSSLVHDAWVARERARPGGPRPDRAHLMGPYAGLPEAEKEKDRAFAREAAGQVTGQSAAAPAGADALQGHADALAGLYQDAAGTSYDEIRKQVAERTAGLSVPEARELARRLGAVLPAGVSKSAAVAKVLERIEKRKGQLSENADIAAGLGQEAEPLPAGWKPDTSHLGQGDATAINEGVERAENNLIRGVEERRRKREEEARARRRQPPATTPEPAAAPETPKPKPTPLRPW